jgi:hypothetical protein
MTIAEIASLMKAGRVPPKRRQIDEEKVTYMAVSASKALFSGQALGAQGRLHPMAGAVRDPRPTTYIPGATNSMR